jgi:hypothetical protein
MKKEIAQSVTNAILDQKLTTLTETVTSGFKGIHDRQDTTNGRVGNTEKEQLLLKEQFKYNRIIWYLLTTAVSICIALSSYILFK